MNATRGFDFARKWRAALTNLSRSAKPPKDPLFDLRELCEGLSTGFATQAESRGVEFILDYGLYVPPAAFGNREALDADWRIRLGNALDSGHSWVRLAAASAPESAVTVRLSGSKGAVWQCVLAAPAAAAPEPVTAGVASAILAVHPETAVTLSGYLADLGVKAVLVRGQAELGERLREAGPSCLMALVDPRHAPLPSLSGPAPPLGAILRADATSPPWAQIRLDKPVRARDLAKLVQSPLAARSSPRSPEGKLCVLAVEDNAVSRKVLERFLERLGCQVTLASNGEEAVRAFQPGRHGLVVMDCHMPVLDGWGATEAIRAKEQGAGRAPILALTANLNPDDHARCLRCGMDAVLTKPITIERLRDAIAAWTGRTLDLPRPGSE